MRRLGAIVAMTLWLGGCLSPAEPLPASVQTAVEARLAEADRSYARAAASPDFITRAAFSSDRSSDWVIDFNEARGAYCGTGGCPLQVWVKDGDGVPRLAFDQQVLGWSAETEGGGRSRLVVRLHGALCGRSAIEDCAYAFSWMADRAGAAGQFMPARAGKGRALQPIRLEMDDAPTPARYAVKAFEAACMRAGGTPETGQSLQYLPDLNGDGAREMLFDASIAWCWTEDGLAAVRPDCKAGSCDSRLFSPVGGVWREVLAQPSLRYEIEYGDGAVPVMKVNGAPVTWREPLPTS